MKKILLALSLLIGIGSHAKSLNIDKKTRGLYENVQPLLSSTLAGTGYLLNQDSSSLHFQLAAALLVVLSVILGFRTPKTTGSSIDSMKTFDLNNNFYITPLTITYTHVHNAY
jgi:hypothetical protein